jgi:Zn-finger nucleic acid-binding protein
MNCPNCGGTLRLEDGKDHFVCQYCTRLHFPEPNEDGVRVLGGPTEHSCPVCNAGLVHAAVAKRRVHYCESCRGILVPMETFVEIVVELRSRFAGQSERPLPLDRRDLERVVECPVCRRRMDTHAYGGPGNIVIDNCSRCKLNWLDYRELRRVTRSPDASPQRDAWEMP